MSLNWNKWKVECTLPQIMHAVMTMQSKLAHLHKVKSIWKKRYIQHHLFHGVISQVEQSSYMLWYMYINRTILIFLRRKVPGQTGARTRDLRQHRLALNTNALTLWARLPFLKSSLDNGIQVWYLSTRHVANSGELLYTQCHYGRKKGTRKRHIQLKITKALG
jgi:hypothetical protein